MWRQVPASQLKAPKLRRQPLLVGGVALLVLVLVLLLVLLMQLRVEVLLLLRLQCTNGHRRCQREVCRLVLGLLLLAPGAPQRVARAITAAIHCQALAANKACVPFLFALQAA
jgi:hypothetical protein